MSYPLNSFIILSPKKKKQHKNGDARPRVQNLGWTLVRQLPFTTSPRRNAEILYRPGTFGVNVMRCMSSPFVLIVTSSSFLPPLYRTSADRLSPPESRRFTEEENTWNYQTNDNRKNNSVYFIFYFRLHMTFINIKKLIFFFHQM